MRTRPQFYYRQSGVIPLRRSGDGVEILLVTTRGRGRWTIPKGVVDIGASPVTSAVKEAYEEAGVRGTTSGEPVGSYRYHKWGGECVVEVFVLDVTETLTRWPEALDRRRRWMSPADAIAALRNPELGALIAQVTVHSS